MPADDLDRLTSGVVLFDGDGRIVRINRAATTILSQNDGLTLSGNTLQAASPQQTAALQALINQTTRADAHQPMAGGTLQFERPSGRRPWSVLVIPLPRRRSPTWHLHAVAAVFIHQVAAPDAPTDNTH